MVDGARLFVPKQNLPDGCDGWDFFVASHLPNKGFYCQDTVHILAKLRTKLTTSSNLIVLGDKTACKEHLRDLANHTDKEKHGLTTRSNDKKDKQNFESIRILVSDDVLRCLEEISKTMQTQT